MLQLVIDSVLCSPNIMLHQIIIIAIRYIYIIIALMKYFVHKLLIYSNCRKGTLVLLNDKADYPGVSHVMYNEDDILGTVQTTPFFDHTYVVTVSEHVYMHWVK